MIALFSSSPTHPFYIHRKLEYAAQHYNQIVTWQLQHNREQHEIRLQRLKNFIAQETGSGSSSSTNNNRSNSGGWIQRITQLVITERLKLLKQNENAKLRLEEANRDLETLTALNSSLIHNQTEWSERVLTAQGKLLEQEEALKNWVPKLENKVRLLMEKLDSHGDFPSFPPSPSAQSSSSISSSAMSSTESR